MIDSPDIKADRALAEALAGAVRRAGERIVARRKAGLSVETKADATPVTEADREAEGIILDALRKLAPKVPVVAEEEVAGGRIPDVGSEFVLVDALDGTRDFVNGGDDFTVNVALVRNGSPVLGVVCAPARRRLWIGIAGDGAYSVDESNAWHPIRVRPAHPAPFDIVASRSHRTPETDAFIARFPGSRIVAAGSSLKFCTVAEGKADLYPRLGSTSQWDTAAGDAVLRAAGGRVLTLEGKPLRYGPGKAPGAAAFLNPWFVAAGGVDPFAAPPT
jgi:3'(2'), 5'-bisphosphate nucleotidase